MCLCTHHSVPHLMCSSMVEAPERVLEKVLASCVRLLASCELSHFANDLTTCGPRRLLQVLMAETDVR